MREWIEIWAIIYLIAVNAVSLYMREWIEIASTKHLLIFVVVSLYMREWIEIHELPLLIQIALSLSI